MMDPDHGFDRDQAQKILDGFLISSKILTACTSSEQNLAPREHNILVLIFEPEPNKPRI
jgi:hypothetical protein